MQMGKKVWKLFEIYGNVDIETCHRCFWIQVVHNKYIWNSESMQRHEFFASTLGRPRARVRDFNATPSPIGRSFSGCVMFVFWRSFTPTTSNNCVCLYSNDCQIVNITLMTKVVFPVIRLFLRFWPTAAFIFKGIVCEVLCVWLFLNPFRQGQPPSRPTFETFIWSVWCSFLSVLFLFLLLCSSFRDLSLPLPSHSFFRRLLSGNALPLRSDGDFSSYTASLCWIDFERADLLFLPVAITFIIITNNNGIFSVLFVCLLYTWVSEQVS